MSQYDFGTINPNTTSGTALATLLGNWRDALHSMHKGSTRPGYAVAGTCWVYDGATPWLLMCYDGANDVIVGAINATTHQFVPYVGGSALGDASATARGLVELATDEEAQEGLDNERAVTPAAGAAAYIAQGKHSIWLPASCWWGLDIDERSLTSFELPVLAYSGSVAETAATFVPMPKSWDRNALTYRVYWTGPAGAGAVVFQLSATAYSDDDPMPGTLGSAVSVSDTFIAAADLHITAESSAVTVGGSPAEADGVVLRLGRNPSDVNDTKAEDAQVFGVMLYYGIDARNDA